MIRIPKNITTQNKYTSGHEYFHRGTKIPYKGYYFVVNEQAYAGKEPDKNSKPLDKIKDVLLNAALGLAKQAIIKFVFDPKKVTSTVNGRTPRYFAKINNETPLRIFEIDFVTYKSIQNNPSYQTVLINWSLEGDNIQEIEKAEKTMPGIRTFLQDSQ